MCLRDVEGYFIAGTRYTQIPGNLIDILCWNFTFNNLFQVLVTNHPCKNKKDKTCVGKITVLYEGHKIHVLLDENRNRLKLIVDGEKVSDFSEIIQWANARETATKHIKLLLTAIQVEVIFYFITIFYKIL